MFEVVDHGHIWGAFVVRGTGGFAGQVAIFVGPEARDRAEAYAGWLNAGGRLPPAARRPGVPGRGRPPYVTLGAQTFPGAAPYGPAGVSHQRAFVPTLGAPSASGGPVQQAGVVARHLFRQAARRDVGGRA